MSGSIRSSRRIPPTIPRIRAKNAINLLALNLGAHAQTPTRWQLSTYPDWARPLHHAAAGGRQPGCVQAERAGAAPQPDDRRHHDQAEREAGHLCGARSGAVSRLPCDDAGGAASAARAQGHPRGAGGRAMASATARRRRKERGGRRCWRNSATASIRSGWCFLAGIDYQTYVAMLQRSDAHVYLTYPFVASWSLREALATAAS